MEDPQQPPGNGGRRAVEEPPRLDESLLPEVLRKASCGDVDYLKRYRKDVNDLLLVQLHDKHGDTALHLASRFGHVEFVKEILNRFRREGDGHGHPPPHPSRDTDLLLENKNGDTALHDAIQYKHVPVAMMLLEAEYSLVLGDTHKRNSSLLYLAAERGLEVVVTRLIHAGAKDDDGPNGSTALHAAVKSEARSIIVPLLLEKRPGLRMKANSHGDLPLHHAAYLGDTKIVSLLLGDASSSFSDSVYSPNQDGNTSIHMAAMAGHLPVVRQLVVACPDGGAVVNNRGRNALHLAIQNERTHVIEYMLQHPQLGSLIYQKDEDGNGPLHLAVLHWNPKVFELLLDDPKLDKLARNGKDQTALDVFLEKDEPEHTLQWYHAQLLLRKAIPHFPATEDKIQEDLERNHELNREANKQIQSKLEKDRGSIMTMGALVAAVTFAAAFTVPGGYRSDSGAQEGLPIFLRLAAFKVFIVSDMVTMGTSLAAMFLCVYATWDYVHSVLHFWTAIRLLMMISFAGMTTAFAAGMYTILAPEALWLAVLVCAMCGGLPFLAYTWAKWRVLELLFRGRWRKMTIRRPHSNDPTTPLPPSSKPLHHKAHVLVGPRDPQSIAGKFVGRVRYAEPAEKNFEDPDLLLSTVEDDDRIREATPSSHVVDMNGAPSECGPSAPPSEDSHSRNSTSPPAVDAADEMP